MSVKPRGTSVRVLPAGHEATAARSGLAPRCGRKLDRFDSLVGAGRHRPARYLPEVCEGADYFVPEFFQELQRSRAVFFWTSCATG